MKSFFIILISSFLLLIIVIYSACKRDDSSPENEWTEDEMKSYQDAIGLQNQVGEDLGIWFQTMDSADAVNLAYQSFQNSEHVSSTTMNSQGIAVQYKNGMRGGLFIYTEDDDFEKSSLLYDPEYDNSKGCLKSLVNPRKMILLNPHYYERQAFTDQVVQKTNINLSKVGMNINPIYKNEEATVDRFTQLSGYGVVQIYSHGWAWPKKYNITEVYLMTGEEANVNTSKKYWSDLKDGNIPVVKVSSTSNKYFLSPQFIMDHNDFSNDTIMFYGGFCFSFLGSWPDLVYSFADGAYLGFDWRVKTWNNANWSVNSIYKMADTALNQPMTLQGWFDDPGVAKSYWDNGDSRTVRIQYVGDGTLTLWNDVKISLNAMSADGVPVSAPGTAGVAYPFKCTAVTNISPLQYVWDIGDGSTPVATDGNEVLITWNNDGSFLLKVDVKNKNTGEFIGSASVNVKIGDDNHEIVDAVTACNKIHASIFPSTEVINGCTIGSLSAENLNWSGLNFNGSQTDEYGNIDKLSGTISADGNTVTIILEQDFKALWTEYEHHIKLTITDYPFSYLEGTSVSYSRLFPNQQNYITDLSGTYTSAEGETNTLSLSDLNYSSITGLYVTFSLSN